MSVVIEDPGMMTTIQDRGRAGWRHMGVPASGAADILSLAMANRLVGNKPDSPALEITLTGAVLRFNQPTMFALSGGKAEIWHNKRRIGSHSTCQAEKGDRVVVGPIEAGARIYLSVAGGFIGTTVFGSMSTYVPASLGGHHGRALRAGDELSIGPCMPCDIVRTPAGLIPYLSDGWVLRVLEGPEIGLVENSGKQDLFTEAFLVSNRISRMGAELTGQKLILKKYDIPSAAVFPGTVQCPGEGNPFLLMADAQTTGGYPRIAQVIRADRHLLGQVRPGDTVRFMMVEADQADQILRKKTALYADWLGYCPFT